ncbi:hypothetical protein BDV18DRAFT_136436 [Aspergillus unguis]
MRPQTMTTTSTPNQPVGPLETLVQDHSTSIQAASSVSGACVLMRLSKWLSSCRSAPPSSAGSNGECKKAASNKNVTSCIEDTSSNSETESSFPCRACKSWGVECDRQKPRCAHCLDQQILCFYVEPLRVTMKRSKEERSRTRMDAVTSPPNE